MKKILLLSNLGWMLVTTFLITNASKPTIISPTQAPQTPPCIADDVPFMNANIFLSGLARYKNYQLKAINDKLGQADLMGATFQDARSCWYSVDRLKSFICLIEKNVPPSSGDRAIDELGIRFYYAAYPDTVHQTALLKAGNFSRPAYVNVGMHHTLFMVPTVHNSETHLEEDVFMQPFVKTRIIINRKKLPSIITHPDWETLIRAPQTQFLVLGNLSPSSKNQGMLCPPTCPTDAAATLNKADVLASSVSIH